MIRKKITTIDRKTGRVIEEKPGRAVEVDEMKYYKTLRDMCVESIKRQEKERLGF